MHCVGYFRENVCDRGILPGDIKTEKRTILNCFSKSRRQAFVLIAPAAARVKQARWLFVLSYTGFNASSHLFFDFSLTFAKSFKLILQSRSRSV